MWPIHRKRRLQTFNNFEAEIEHPRTQPEHLEKPKGISLLVHLGMLHISHGLNA